MRAHWPSTTAEGPVLRAPPSARQGTTDQTNSFMARGRMISKSLSTSERRARLHDLAGPLAEFTQGLYPLMVAHADDFGRLQGDLFTVKHVIDPSSPRTLEEFGHAVAGLHQVGLVEWYEVNGRKFIQIVKFDDHQQGLHRRTKSESPPPPSQVGPRTSQPLPLDASEADIEGAIADDLLSGRLSICDFTITGVERQVRKGASYLDLVATTTDSLSILIEVKRHRVTPGAISQIRAYTELLIGEVLPIVIGHGVAETLVLPLSDVVVAIYDDSGRIATVNPIYVKSQLVLLNHIPSELKGTEGKGTEGKRTVQDSGSAAAVPPTAQESSSPTAGDPWRGRQGSKPSDDQNFAVIVKLAHEVMDTVGVVDPESPDLVDLVKESCAKAHINYTADPSVLRRAIACAATQKKIAAVRPGRGTGTHRSAHA